MIEIDEAVKHDVLPNLDILPAGTVAPNPSELMCSTRFQELYEQFVRDYDYVILIRLLSVWLPTLCFSRI